MLSILRRDRRGIAGGRAELCRDVPHETLALPHCPIHLGGETLDQTGIAGPASGGEALAQRGDALAQILQFAPFVSQHRGPRRGCFTAGLSWRIFVAFGLSRSPVWRGGVPPDSAAPIPPLPLFPLSGWNRPRPGA